MSARQQLVDGIFGQSGKTEDGELNLGIVLMKESLDFGVGGKFLMKIGNGKGENDKIRTVS